MPSQLHKSSRRCSGRPASTTSPASSTAARLALAFPVDGKPSWAQESLTKANTDVMAHWTSKLFDEVVIEALGGLHNEHFNDRSPSAALNGQNQLGHWGSNLWDSRTCLAASRRANGTQPCPVNPTYHTGGFGTVVKYTANRWSGELKSTHNVEGGGHHEIKYGWHLEYGTFDLDRYYSGPTGDHNLVDIAPNGGNLVRCSPSCTSTRTNFSTASAERAVPRGLRVQRRMMSSLHPSSDLGLPPYYQENLKADVKNVSNAFYLQDSWSPWFLRNLTIGAGARLDLQRLYDLNGASFLSANNLSPRITAVLDPFNDGRSKISAAYGRYYEAIPMDIAARYFGGENFLVRNGVPLDMCANSNPYTWTGNGEYQKCTQPMPGNYAGPDDRRLSQACQQRQRPAPVAPAGAVRQRGRRDGRAPGHGGHDGPPGLHPPLDRHDHRGRLRRPELQQRPREPGPRAGGGAQRRQERQ